MLFNSFQFVILVLVTFSIYYSGFLNKFQYHILIFASLIFYSYHVPLLVLLLISSAAINSSISYLILYKRLNRIRLFSILGVIINLSILFFFKYSPLISKTFFPANSSLGEFLLYIPLPIGISFFTFQGISLVVDVFTKKHHLEFSPSEKSFRQHTLKIFLYITFFPQLIAGPIVKAHEFIPQIKKKYLSEIDWQDCIKKIILGYFLKMVIADNLKDYTFWISYPYFLDLSSLTLIVLLFGYSFQIFADFAGYSLIAIGIASIFGYKLKDNFNFPYISTSFKEFWTRWHISLSTFLKEYLYIPLGGNRKGKFRTYLNLFITMLLGGLWHGAAWSYAVWGFFHGILLAIERAFQNSVPARYRIKSKLINGALIFIAVTFAWLLFKLPDFNNVISYLEAIFHNYGSLKITPIVYIFIYSIPVIIYHIYYLLVTYNYQVKLNKVKYIPYGIMLFLLIFNSGTPGAFIYFQF